MIRRTYLVQHWRQLVSISCMLACWAFLSIWLESPSLPTPQQVYVTGLRELNSGELLLHCFHTMYRVLIAFTVAMLLGIVFGLLLGLSRKVNQFFDVWLITLLNMPALVVIILCYLWIGLSETAAIIAVALNKIPNITVIVREGTRALDDKLMQMAKVFRLTWSVTLRQIILPQLTPYFVAAARSGLALIWKIVLVVELLGRSNGVGFQLHLAFQMFDVASILVYSLAFIGFIWLVEIGLIKPWDRRANRWRSNHAY